MGWALVPRRQRNGVHDDVVAVVPDDRVERATARDDDQPRWSCAGEHVSWKGAFRIGPSGDDHIASRAARRAELDRVTGPGALERPQRTLSLGRRIDVPVQHYRPGRGTRARSPGPPAHVPDIHRDAESVLL